MDLHATLALMTEALTTSESFATKSERVRHALLLEIERRHTWATLALTSLGLLPVVRFQIVKDGHIQDPEGGGVPEPVVLYRRVEHRIDLILKSLSAEAIESLLAGFETRFNSYAASYSQRFGGGVTPAHVEPPTAPRKPPTAPTPPPVLAPASAPDPDDDDELAGGVEVESPDGEDADPEVLAVVAF